jgi:membrane-associated protease RseP (regulator of RpoE activity)
MESVLDIGVNSQIRERVDRLFDIESTVIGGKTEGEAVLRFSGRFRVPTQLAYEELATWLGELGYAAMFREEDGKEEILIVPQTQSSTVRGSHLNILLLLLTMLSTLFVGAMMVTETVADFLHQPWVGLPFALSIMAILGAHELGHYFAARQFGVQVTLPYFIPMPLGPFGTLGAFISMKSSPPNRKALLAIAVAGPLSGFLLAVPILLLGLSLSSVTTLFAGDGVVMEGNSLLYALLKLVTFGKLLPSGQEDVFLHPVAFAGWAGLLVTGLNLIPVGQLDGGHIVYALLGKKAGHLIWPVVVCLIGLGISWNGWFLWVMLILLFGRKHAAPLDDLTTLTGRERIIGWSVMVLFAMVFTPFPLTVF